MRFKKSLFSSFFALLAGFAIGFGIETNHNSAKAIELDPYIPTTTGATQAEVTVSCGEQSWHSFEFSIFTEETGEDAYDGFYSVIRKYRITLHEDFVENVDLTTLECSTPFDDASGDIITVDCDGGSHTVTTGGINLTTSVSLTDNGDGTYEVLWEYDDPNLADATASTRPWMSTLDEMPDGNPPPDSYQEWIWFYPNDSGVYDGDTATTSAELYREIYGVDVEADGDWDYGPSLADDASIGFENNDWYTDGDTAETTFEDCGEEPVCDDLDITSPTTITAEEVDDPIEITIDVDDQNGDTWDGTYEYSSDGTCLFANTEANALNGDGSNPKETSRETQWVHSCTPGDTISIEETDSDYLPECSDDLTIEEEEPVCVDLTIISDITIDATDATDPIDIEISVVDQNTDTYSGEYTYTAEHPDGTLATSCIFEGGYWWWPTDGNPLTTTDETVELTGCDEADIIEGIEIHVVETDYPTVCLDDFPITPYCGDSFLDEDGADNAPGGGDDEECDDGNTVSGDGCSSSCNDETTTNECGDGNIDVGETCDDGNTNNDDSCNNSCQPPTDDDTTDECGDGNLDAGEACDDGNTNNDDSCNNSCQPPTDDDDDDDEEPYCYDFEIYEPTNGEFSEFPVDFEVQAIGAVGSGPSATFDWDSDVEGLEKVDYIYQWSTTDTGDFEFTSDSGSFEADDGENGIYYTNDTEVTYEGTELDAEISVRVAIDENSVSTDQRCMADFTAVNYCGDGIKDDDEACDDGDMNGTTTSSCSDTCELTAVNDNITKTVDTYNFGFMTVDSTEIRADGFETSNPYGHDYDYAFYELVYTPDSNGGLTDVNITDDIVGGIEGKFPDGTTVPNAEITPYYADGDEPDDLITDWTGTDQHFTVEHFSAALTYLGDIEVCPPPPAEGEDATEEDPEVCYEGDIFTSAGIDLQNVNLFDEDDRIVIRYLGRVDNGDFDCTDDDNPDCPVIEFENTARVDGGEEYDRPEDDAAVTIICPYLLTRNAGDVFLEEELEQGFDLSCYYDRSNSDGLVMLQKTADNLGCDTIGESGNNTLIERFSSYICEVLTDVSNVEISEWDRAVIEQQVTEVQVEAVTRYTESFSPAPIQIFEDIFSIAPTQTNPNQNVYSIEGDLTLGNGQTPITVPSEAWTFIIHGDLYIESDIIYENVDLTLIENLKEIPSIAFIVIGGDVHVSSLVSNMVGVYYVQEDNGEGGSITGDWTDPFTSLEIFGSVYGNMDDEGGLLEQRTFSGPANYDHGNVVIRYDSRVLLNTPPGLEEFVDVSGGEVAR